MTINGKKLKRPRYFDRQQLRSDDLALEQSYQDARMQQLNQYLHGWGVVCGALVSEYKDLSLVLNEGFAISPGGNTIHIPYISELDLEHMIEEACGQVEKYCESDLEKEKNEDKKNKEVSKKVYLVASASDKSVSPRSSIPEDCGHSGNTMEYSRTCDTVKLRIVCDLPLLHQPQKTDCDMMRKYFCAEYGADVKAEILNTLFSCPPHICEDEDYVVIATLTLNYSKKNSKAFIKNVQYGERRVLVSVDLLQRYMSCLCSYSRPDITREPTEEPTQEPTKDPTQEPTKEPTRGPTREPTWEPTRWPTAEPTWEPTRWPTAEPTWEPTWEPTNIPWTRFPDGELTMPVDYLDVEGIDVRKYDTRRGSKTNIDEMVLLGSESKQNLHENGINSVLDLYVTETSELSELLGISEVLVAEYKENALVSMQRAEVLTLENETYDVNKGMSMEVEEVHNIGRTRGETLTSAGYASLADIANSSAAILSSTIGVSEETAGEMIGDAQSRILR